ncbi:MAG: PorT family protein [Prevotella sp.]|nr:PorT family protein [Prevotella sp.]
MKKLMMMAAMMVAAVSANAQNEVGGVTLKPMAGVNLATMTSTDDSKMRVGLVAGVEGEYGVAEKFGVTAGVLYSMQGVKFNALGVDLTYKLDYINVPILANYYLTKGLAIKAGLQPGLNVAKKLKAEAGGVSAEESIDGGVNSFTLAIPVGVSYEYNSFVLDARYNLGITSALDVSGSEHSVFSFTLGYKFGL